MKKIFAVLFAGLLIFIMARFKSFCSTTATSAQIVEPDEAKTNETATEADRKFVVGFAQTGAENEWRIACTNSIKEEAEKRNIDLVFADSQNNQENQIKAIRAFIVQKVDVIGVAPIVESGWEAVFREAKDAGIPIVLVDRNAKVSEDLFVTKIGSDFKEEGKKAAEEMAKVLGGKGKIVELRSTTSLVTTRGRLEGFKEVIETKYPEIEIIKSQTSDFTRAKGKEVMEAFLKSDGKNIQGVYAHNDDMAIGAIQAIEEYGLKPGIDIKIISVDGIRDAFKAMAAGKLNAIVECNPLLGPQFFDICEKIISGEKVPKYITSQEGVYRQDMAVKELPGRLY